MDGMTAFRFENEKRVHRYPIGNMAVERYDTDPINRTIARDELFGNDKRNVFLVSSEGRTVIAKSEFNREKKRANVVFMLRATTDGQKIRVSNEKCDESGYLHFFKKERTRDHNYDLTETVNKILCTYDEYVFDVLRILKTKGENGPRIFLRLKKRTHDRAKEEGDERAFRDKTKQKRSGSRFVAFRRLLFCLSLLFTACYAAFGLFIYRYHFRCIALPLDKLFPCVLQRDVEIDF